MVCGDKVSTMVDVSAKKCCGSRRNIFLRRTSVARTDYFFSKFDQNIKISREGKYGLKPPYVVKGTREYVFELAPDAVSIWHHLSLLAKFEARFRFFHLKFKHFQDFRVISMSTKKIKNVFPRKFSGFRFHFRTSQVDSSKPLIASSKTRKSYFGHLATLWIFIYPKKIIFFPEALC
jgi:hypothetical protein